MKRSGAPTAAIHADTDVTLHPVSGTTTTSTQTINTGTNANVNHISADTQTNINRIRVTQDSAGVVEINANTSIHTTPVHISAAPKISDPITIYDGNSDDHRALKHLDYESSGHTGFASSAQLEAALKAEVTISSSSGTINPDDLNKLKSNLSAKIELDGQVLSLTAKAGKQWTYTSALDGVTGDMTILTLDTSNGTYTSQTRNPARDEMNAHINNTSVHLQAGERNT